jgi:hypothetical protein
MLIRHRSPGDAELRVRSECKGRPSWERMNDMASLPKSARDSKIQLSEGFFVSRRGGTEWVNIRPPWSRLIRLTLTQPIFEVLPVPYETVGNVVSWILNKRQSRSSIGAS